MIAVDLANAVFIVCLGVAGLILLVGILLDDEVGPILDFLRLRSGIHGVPFVIFALAYVCGFGIGGLVGTAGLNAEALPAAGLGIVGGLVAVALTWVLSDSRTLRKASTADPSVDLEELVGRRGYVSMSLRPNALGTVSVAYRGTDREFPATAKADIPADSVVVVDDVDAANSTLVVTPLSDTNHSQNAKRNRNGDNPSR